MAILETSAAAIEIQKASMVTLFGVTFNIYAAVLFAMLIFFIIAWYRTAKARKLDWVDMITRDGTKISATKVLQLVGGVVGTFIIIKVTLQGQLDWDLFAIYLAYVASIDGFSKFIMAKYGAENSDDSAVPYPRRRRNNYGYGYDHDDNYYDRSSGPRSSKKEVVADDSENAESIGLNGGAKADID